jgi:uncharacterized heparinase superfamily protein
MKRKVTAAVAAKIRARRAQGVQITDLAKEFGLGLATIHGALATKGRMTAAIEPAPTTEEGAEVPTRDDLLRFLADQAKSLRADAAKAADPATRAAANRNLIAVQALITKLVPPPAEPAGMMLVSEAEFAGASETGQARLQALIKDIFEDQKNWPRCHACHQQIPPADIATRIGNVQP